MSNIIGNAQPAYLAVSLQGKNLLEASAGTGKTFTVALLYLRALLGVGTPNNKPLAVEDVLVVTFTNAATEELIDRIRLRIKEAIAYIDAPGKDGALIDVLGAAFSLHDNDKDQCKTLLRTALSHISFANISTIHSFCADVCKSIAIDSGLPLAMTLSTDAEDINASIMDVWRENIGQGDKYYQSLVGSHGQHEKIYKKALQKQLGELTLPNGAILKSDFFSVVPERCTLEAFFDKYGASYTAPYNNANKVIKALDDLYAVEERHPKMATGTLKFFSASNLGIKGKVSKKADESLLAELDKDVSENAFFKFCDQFHATTARTIPLVDFSFLYASYQSLLIRLSKAESTTGNIYSDRLIQLAADVSDDERIAELMRKKLPLAIIDEFQDTDPFQYRLFKNIYSGDDCGLLMVGDPKQAIYAFRGGDIYTYLQAKADAENTYNLDANFRSADAVVAGINKIFEQPLSEDHNKHEEGAFNQEAIDFVSVKAKAGKPLLMVKQAGELKPLEAVVGEYIPDNADCTLNAAARQRVTARDAAKYIQKLVALADSGQCLMLDDDSDDSESRPLKRGDIALLVNSHGEATLLKGALLDLGVASLTQSRESIFKELEAYDIWLILRAISEPTNQRYFEAALLAQINGLGYRKAYEVINDETMLQQWIAKFHELNELFLKLGPLVALTRWFNLIGATQSFMQLENDRQATNVTQLLELLQEDYALFGGGLKLLSRLERSIASEESSDESLIRLESDEDRVKIITIHSSKGLEYPVVLVPFAWRDSVQVRDKLFSGHDDEGNALLGFSVEIKESQNQGLLDEKLRLFYVALTRASRHLVLYFIDANKPRGTEPSAAYNNSPLGWYFPTAADSDSVSRAHADFITALAPINAGCIRLEDCTVANTLTASAANDESKSERISRAFDGKVDQRMGTSSFSMITRGYSVALKDDDELAGKEEQAKEAAHILEGRHALARGANIGNALHNVMEFTDFTQWQGEVTDRTQDNLNHLVRRELKANGVILKAEQLEEDLLKYTQWMTEVIQAPFLKVGNDDIALAHLTHWQAELTFTFALSRSFSKGGLRDLLRDLGYSLEGLKGPSIYGMLTGAIDLVFSHDGKYYLADYKSNHLGSDFDAYTEEALDSNNDKKAYTLQYLIYSLALHLHLAERIENYDYAEHFGGVFYLYMRGMHPEHKGKGVFYHLPEKHVIDALSSYLIPEHSTEMEASI
ncbi:MAG: exodeoxyribonuclease V beta subunit [Oleiphilaceae bacterium]|jgi:exodeoxyribonuclease V beta subunit